MTERVETVIVGAGQAGLAVSYCLTQLGREHLVLERGRVGERWRSERWDSFVLLSPRWHTRLPGYHYRGEDPDGFMDRAEIVRHLEGYGASFGAPVRPDSAVTSVGPLADSGRYVVGVDHATAIETGNVVVAIGGFQRPRLPSLRRDLPPDLFQVHTNDYRNPDQLPPEAVLIVGSGTSGQQIAEELQRSGRQVYLSVGRHARLPRRYRGKDAVWWLDKTGIFDQIADEMPRERRRPGAALTGVDGGHDLDLRQLAVDGVVLLGHLRGVEGSKLGFALDVEKSLAAGDQVAIDFKKRADEYVLEMGVDVPEEEEPAFPPRWRGRARPEPVEEPALSLSKGAWEGGIEKVDLRAAGITSVIWCTGYTYDLDWLRAPVLDKAGEPVHQRGVTPCPGLYFIGLQWLYKRKSSFIDGVAEDAVYLAEYMRVGKR